MPDSRRNLRPYNITQRASFRGGWLALLSGESQGKALDRVLPRLNDAGYKVRFVVNDDFSIFKHVFSLLIGILTLGFWWPVPGLLIIGELTEE